MGQAKRRKELGLMPERLPKPRKIARRKIEPENMIIGMGGLSMLMGSLMMRGASGELFAIRSEMARMNREAPPF